ncbi:hypothetical protein FJZ18_00785 [Candidatus Pacearchaeota archaeon]|nr:hypothetical protein [Candidatus Pacearchaeota archaeon]
MIIRSVKEVEDFYKKWDGLDLECPSHGKIEHVVVCDNDGIPMYDQYMIWEGVKRNDGKYPLVSGAAIIPYYKSGESLFIGILSKIRPIVHDETTGKPGCFISLEIPRGFESVSDCSPEATAIKELGEETKMLTRKIFQIGKYNPNTAFYVTPGIPIFAAEVDPRIKNEVSPDATEKILSCNFILLEEVKKMIKRGEIIDGFTLAAIACFEGHVKNPD